MSELLQVRGLTTHFLTRNGAVKAVENVSFSVGHGETIALVGESGCGKTACALSILRLVQEPAGKIIAGEALFEGIDLLSLPEDKMRRIRGGKIAMVFQEPMTSLNPVLTIGKQIAESLELHQHLGKEEATAEAIRLLAMSGIPDPESRIKAYPHHFSGGMRQRAMVAMAISCRPRLLIADEPTTALDVTVQAQVLEFIRRVTRELGTAMILITHNLGIVARYASRVYVMYAGRIAEYGAIQDVFRDPQHPYTAGLLASLPRLDEPRKTTLRQIRGQAPECTSRLSGCAFAPRCDFCSPVCGEQGMDLYEVSPGHYTVCRQGRQSK